MSLLVIPHTFTAGQTEPAVWLNDNFSAIQAIVNNLDDANIAAGANIQGTKIAMAPDGLPTSRYNDQTVTSDKLAILASTRLRAIVGATPGLGITGAEMVVATLPAFATRGGVVLIGGSIAFVWGYFSVLAVTATVIIRLYRTGLLVDQQNFDLAGNAGVGSVAIPCPHFLDVAPAASSHIYELRATRVGAGQINTAGANPGKLYGIEFS